MLVLLSRFICLITQKGGRVEGFINDLKFIENGRKLVCAVGQEHKSGRWWKNCDSKNSIVIFTLNKEEENNTTTAVTTATSTIVVG
uniref:Uncharacterized protein n=1 Tax=Panagrolaimus sp. ES5 TaxID=591445 RepID=A0AC34FCF0_9BILA